VLPAQQATGSLGHPGRSARTQYRRRRAAELAVWTRSLAWRAPLVAAAGLTGVLLTTWAGLPHAELLGLAVAALTGWRLRFRPSEQSRTWQRGAHGSGILPGSWTGSRVTATWSCTTWPCPARQPTSTTW
jgi:hypothetical protein